MASLWRECAALAAQVASGQRPRQDATVARQASIRAAAYDSQVLRHAVLTNSPDEVYWLLCAAMLTDAAKRRYCLERALAINPASDVARRALAKLDGAA